MRSTLAEDKMNEKLKRKLLTSSTTCWNSYYDAVARVIENSSATLMNCVSALVPEFSLRRNCHF